MAEKRITWDLLKILLQKIYKRLDGLIRDVRQKAQQIPIGGRPMFEDGIIEMELYNNYANKPGAAATLELIDTPPDCPIKRDKIRKYTLPWNTPVAPNLGGFEQYIQTAPNKVFLHRFIAKLPKGTYFTVNYNDHGDGAETIWLTKTYGTGKYEIYAYQIQCGATGSFKTIGYVSFYEGISTKLDRSKPFEAYIAEANIYELTTPSVQPVSLPEVNKLIDKKMQDTGGLKVEPMFVNEVENGQSTLSQDIVDFLSAYFQLPNDDVLLYDEMLPEIGGKENSISLSNGWYWKPTKSEYGNVPIRIIRIDFEVGGNRDIYIFFSGVTERKPGTNHHFAISIKYLLTTDDIRTTFWQASDTKIIELD